MCEPHAASTIARTARVCDGKCKSGSTARHDACTVGLRATPVSRECTGGPASTRLPELGSNLRPKAGTLFIEDVAKRFVALNSCDFVDSPVARVNHDCRRVRAGANRRGRLTRVGQSTCRRNRDLRIPERSDDSGAVSFVDSRINDAPARLRYDRSHVCNGGRGSNLNGSVGEEPERPLNRSDLPIEMWLDQVRDKQLGQGSDAVQECRGARTRAVDQFCRLD
jgi:hypothetical protein